MEIYITIFLVKFEGGLVYWLKHKTLNICKVLCLGF